MVAKINPVYHYCLDKSDQIVDVDEWWLAFAKENGAGELTRANVVGRLLWDFVCDEPTRTLYQEIHAQVRSTGNSIIVPFRCDSPGLKRFMQVKISLAADQRLNYESRMVRVIARAAIHILEPSRERSKAFLTMCSLCKRSLLEPTGWLELQDISLQLRIFDQQRVPQLRYTICPNCSNSAAEAPPHVPTE